jgi:transposase
MSQASVIADPGVLSDEQWVLIADLLADPAPDPRGGRPRHDSRRCLEGVLWVLRSGARWKDLPRTFPSYVTCWRRFAAWSASGVWEKAWRRLLNKLDLQGGIDWRQGAADGTFASAKKGAISSVRPSAARGPSSCSWSMAAGFLSA